MAGSLKTLNIYQNGSSIYNASTFTSYGIWTDGNKIYKTNNHTPQSGDTELVTLTTTISGLYHNADGERVSVGLNTVLVITTIAATDIIVYCVNASNKTTLDLSTLSDIADGAHTVKVKAKADGYRDSEFSNEVSYTKSSGYTVTFTRAQSGMNGRWQYTTSNGAVWSEITESATPIVIESITQIKFRTKSYQAGFPYETYMSWNNPTGRIDCDTGEWVVSDTIIPTGNMSVVYSGDNNPV